MFGGHETGDVFPDQIEFQVNGGAGDDSLYIGMFERIGDDGNVKAIFFDVKDSEADAIERNGAFFDHEVAKFLWEFEAEFPTALEFLSFCAGGGGIDVTLDDMAVEPAVHDHTAFQVDEVPGLPGIEAGLLEGFFDGGHAVGIGQYFFDREAGAVMGDALVDLKFGGEGGLDPECSIGAFGFDGSYRAE